jgi:hypothetical protein
VLQGGAAEQGVASEGEQRQDGECEQACYRHSMDCLR